MFTLPLFLGDIPTPLSLHAMIETADILMAVLSKHEGCFVKWSFPGPDTARPSIQPGGKSREFSSKHWGKSFHETEVLVDFMFKSSTQF